MFFPKPIREKAPDYLDYIRSLRCLCSGPECTGEVAPHHAKSVGAGGSDYLTLPLCARHHAEAHQSGLSSLEYRHRFDRQTAIMRLLIGYIRRALRPAEGSRNLLPH